MLEIGSLAKQKGYNAIRFNSERSKAGVNIAVIDSFNDVLTPIMVTPIK